MSTLTNRFTDALVYCVRVHSGQQRKGKSTPYVAHLLSVSALVLEDGGDEDEAIAALLHDALEDQPDRTSQEEIGQRFGDHVLHLVLSCTDTPPDYQGGEKPRWRQRKETYLAHLRDGAGSDLRVALADKLHNVRELLADYRCEGDNLWSRFNAGKADQLWYYQALVVAFRQGGVRGQMLLEFERVVSEFVHLVEAA